MRWSGAESVDEWTNNSHGHHSIALFVGLRRRRDRISIRRRQQHRNVIPAGARQPPTPADGTRKSSALTSSCRRPCGSASERTEEDDPQQHVSQVHCGLDHRVQTRRDIPDRSEGGQLRTAIIRNMAFESCMEVFGSEFDAAGPLRGGRRRMNKIGDKKIRYYIVLCLIGSIIKI